MVTLTLRSALLAAVIYACLFCNPVNWAIQDMAQTGTAGNGYSPYTMFERCHATQLHIPDGGC